MKLRIEKYENAGAWADAVADAIKTDVELVKLLHSDVNLLLSGGSTPGPIYKRLDREISSFSDINIGLVDERFVPTDDANSNEKLIKDCFALRPSDAYSIQGMVKDDQDEMKNLEMVRAAYSSFKKRTDIVVLGMGGDGHTASIFPFDPASDSVRKNGQNDIFSTKAPVNPKNRITCSVELICRARHIYLLIGGDKKLKVLNEYHFQHPIHSVLERRPDTRIFYLEK